jgi:methionyl-tRNA formyltransferase
MKIVFFGSTSDSVLVLQKLAGVVAVVTQPPKPIGRKQIVTPTPVETWAKAHGLPVTTLDVVAPFKPDLLVSASYGEKIPMEIITNSRYGGLNVHPSILPRWRGADPVPWAILQSDHQIGVTVVTLSEKFDQGLIIAQKKIPITPTDTTIPLRTHLFAIGADLLIDSLPDYISGKNKGREQIPGNEPVSKRLTRDDGFEPWEKIIDPKESERVNRKYRALHPWPGLWTTFERKRLKILEFTHTPVTVQLEGKTPVSFRQFVLDRHLTLD